MKISRNKLPTEPGHQRATHLFSPLVPLHYCRLRPKARSSSGHSDQVHPIISAARDNPSSDHGLIIAFLISGLYKTRELGQIKSQRR